MKRARLSMVDERVDNRTPHRSFKALLLRANGSWSGKKKRTISVWKEMSCGDPYSVLTTNNV